jgi:hypothetical protein
MLRSAQSEAAEAVAGVAGGGPRSVEPSVAGFEALLLNGLELLRSAAGGAAGAAAGEARGELPGVAPASERADEAIASCGVEPLSVAGCAAWPLSIRLQSEAGKPVEAEGGEGGDPRAGRSEGGDPRAGRVAAGALVELRRLHGPPWPSVVAAALLAAETRRAS